ncbi:PAS domain-containing protein [Mucilaginibacter sp. FT3.2]|uniref:PAS domain-containing protein n=1 Tax=Mucilaginibacter sp. FT3.2 TaxID=2723090 RepID=UPI001622EB3C|nr:PAS domain-containing protein [Mucilaginibacter sp. FT3.2]MBB6230675.1 PAS domain S-box-containing protein [Mucilaginibacter sp. FT3.2]
MLKQVNPYQIFNILPSPCLVLIPDAPQFTVADCNCAFATLSGLPQTAIAGKSALSVVAGEETGAAADILKAMHLALEQKTAVQLDAFEGNENLGTGRFFDIAITPLTDDEDSVYCLLLTLTDATEAIAMKQQAAIDASELKNAALLMSQVQEMASFGNWKWDIAQNVVTWSDALYHIYGLDKAAFKATFEGYRELLHPNDRERITNRIGEALQQQQDITFEERIIRPTGEIRYLQSWGRVQTNHLGQPVAMIGACLDVTERRMNEATLNTERQRRVADVEQQNKQLNEIAWMQSHVIRAPLARTMGLIEVYRSCDADDSERADLITQISDSVWELDAIIREIVGRAERV